MNRIRSTVLCLVISFLAVNGMSAKSYDVSQLPIVVRNMPEWSNEYPTVINNWEGMFVKSVNGELPPILSVVTSINGKDTKGMSEEDFNALLMSQGKSVIEYLVKSEGKNVRKQCTLQYHTSIYWAEGITMADPEAFPGDIEIRNIKNASVFSMNTFSYQLGKVSEIDEKAVLDAASKSFVKMGFAKVEDDNNADMILSLSKSRDNNNGYKVTLSVFDGKSLRNDVERVLWSLDILDLRENLAAQESTLKTTINRMCNQFPFDQPTYSLSIYTLGVAFVDEQSVSTGKVLKVLKGSDAYEKGLRDGDAIVGAYAGYDNSILLIRTRRYYFKPNRKNRQKNWGVDLFFFLPIVPQCTYNNADHYLVDGKSRGGGSSKNHFKVRNSYGQKITMYAPFEKKNFNFKYIR